MSYALAWSWLSRTWTGLGVAYLGGAPAQEAYARARAAADRALGLSPDLAEAHLARGYMLLNTDFDWRGAEAEYRRATELAPNDDYAMFSLGNQLATFGEVEQAIELTREGLTTEPLRANWYYWLANYLSVLNRLDEAGQAIRRQLRCSPVRRAITRSSRSSRSSAVMPKRRSPPRSRSHQECGRKSHSPSHGRSAVTTVRPMQHSGR